MNDMKITNILLTVMCLFLLSLCYLGNRVLNTAIEIKNDTKSVLIEFTLVSEYFKNVLENTVTETIQDAQPTELDWIKARQILLDKVKAMDDE